MAIRQGLLVSVLCLAPAALSAQAPSQFHPQATVGAQLGYSRSSLGGPDAQGTQSHQGALTGVYLQVPLGAALSLRPEILFALKGGRAQAAVVGGGTLDIDIGLAYLEFPALLRFELPSGRFRPLLFGGPAAALQIGCDLQVIDPSFPLRAECNETNLPAFRQFDLSGVIGTGLEVHWPQSSLSLEARYTVGFQSVLNDVDVRNRAFGIVLAMTF